MSLAEPLDGRCPGTLRSRPVHEPFETIRLNGDEVGHVHDAGNLRKRAAIAIVLSDQHFVLGFTRLFLLSGASANREKLQFARIRRKVKPRQAKILRTVEVFVVSPIYLGETQLQPAQPSSILPRPDGKTSAVGRARSGQREGNIGAALIAPILARDRIRAPLPLPHPYPAARSRRFSRRRRPGLPAFNFKNWPLFAKNENPNLAMWSDATFMLILLCVHYRKSSFRYLLMVDDVLTTSETKAIQLRQNMAAKPSASRILANIISQ